jgi:Na+/H+ antiporter NhaD/arsenite permease-like protein
VLDNAPTYLAALATALGRDGLSIDNAADVSAFAAQHPQHLLAISLAAVFFGAGTYIGNGPNFLVKAICQHAGVRTPTFFGYILRFALPVLLPIFALVGWLFLSR